MKSEIDPEKFREIKKSITKYFYCDILDPVHKLSVSLKINIIETFTYAYDHHLSDKEIQEQLEGSNLWEVLQRLRDQNKPFPVRWGVLKPRLQEEALSKGMSMHAFCREIGWHYFNSKDLPDIGEKPHDQ